MRINYLTTNKVKEYINKHISDKVHKLPSLINALFVFLKTDTNEHSPTNYYYVFDEVIDIYLRKLKHKITGKNKNQKIYAYIEKHFKDKDLQIKLCTSYGARFLNK